MRDFARFLNAPRYYLSLGIIAPLYLFSLIGLVPKSTVKSQFIAFHFKHKSKTELQQQGQLFFTQFQSKLFPDAIHYIKTLRAETIETEWIVVSGSCAEWLQPFVESLELTLHCTQLSYSPEAMCLGKLNGANITGKEKVGLIRSAFDLTSYQEIISFGNAKSDRQLTSISTHYYHRHFE